MDIKRLVIAVVISVAVVMGWNYFATKMGWIQEHVEPVTTPVEQPKQEPVPNIAPSAVTPEQLESVKNSPFVDIETPLYKARIAVNGGVLQSFRLTSYFTEAGGDQPFQFFAPNAVNYSPLGLLINATPTWGMGEWTTSEDTLILQGEEQRTVVLQGSVNGMKITRELIFSASSYLIQERTLVATPETQNVQIGYTLDTIQLALNPNYNTTKIAWYIDKTIKTDDDLKDLAKGIEMGGSIQWTGIMDNYFLVAIAPMQIDSTMMRAKYENDVFRTALYTPSLVSSSSSPAVSSTYYYIGPKDSAMLDNAPNNLKESINYGFFAFLSRPLLLFLEFIYSFVHNYGIAIIVLTLAIKLLFWPLSQKSFASMNKMKQMQPLVQELREKYKDNKEEMNKAIMNLYKTYKVNPMGGCLPLLVQIPVFFALYEALLNSLALRHAMFIEYLPFTKIIWLADLSAKDPLYITPVAMGASMFLQQLLTPSTGDPTQRKIMLVMPIVFTVFFFNFPSGLVLYWLASNVISIIQQWLITRQKDEVQSVDI